MIKAVHTALILSTTLLYSGYANASGREPRTPLPPARAGSDTLELSEAERLYSEGRRVFQRKVSCKEDCLLPRKTIKRDNAVEYILKINQDEAFTSVLQPQEIRAVSYYLIRRYKIRIES